MSICVVHLEPQSIGVWQFGGSREAATLSDQCMGLSGECLAAVQLLRIASRGLGLREETSLHAGGSIDEKRSSISRTVPFRE